MVLSRKHLAVFQPSALIYQTLRVPIQISTRISVEQTAQLLRRNNSKQDKRRHRSHSPRRIMVHSVINWNLERVLYLHTRELCDQPLPMQLRSLQTNSRWRRVSPALRTRTTRLRLPWRETMELFYKHTLWRTEKPVLLLPKPKLPTQLSTMLLK